MRRDPIIVAGPQRTGSTLLGRLFASADKSASTVNGKLLLYLLLYLPKENFDHWTAHFRTDEILWLMKRKPILANHPGFTNNFRLNCQRIANDLKAEPLLDTRREYIAEYLYRIYREWQPGAEFWGDKYNEYVLMLDEIASVFPNARFVFTRRVASDAAQSAMVAFGERPWQPVNMQESLNKVLRWDALVERFRESHPSTHVIVVPYEELIVSPKIALEKLEAFTQIYGLVRQSGRVGRERLHDEIMQES